MSLVYQEFMNWSGETSQVGDQPFEIAIGYAVGRDGPDLLALVAIEGPAEEYDESRQSDHVCPTALKNV
jgi:hypothetical protein